MTVHHSLLPPGWKRPKGYANGIAAAGRLIFTGGLVGWDADENFVGDTLPAQFRQVLINTLAVLTEGGAGPEHVVRMTWYVTDRASYLADLGRIGETYRELMGHNYPAMAVVIVSALIEPKALVEIETTAVVPVA